MYLINITNGYSISTHRQTVFAKNNVNVHNHWSHMYLTLHRAKRIAFATSVISMTILSACPLEYLPLWAYLPPSVSGNNK